jgi:hypothetical protein
VHEHGERQASERDGAGGSARANGGAASGVATHDLAGRRRMLQGLQRAAGNAAVARAVAAPKVEVAPQGVQRFAAGPSGHGGIEEGGDAEGHAGAIEEVFGDRAQDVYFGNWLRDMSQLNSSDSFRTLIDILALGEFGPATDLATVHGNLGGYVPSEHLDNPQGGGSVEDGGGPVTDESDAHLSKQQQEEQAFMQTRFFQSELAQATRRSGLPDYIERGKLHAKRKLRQAIATGENPAGMMQMGDALHAVEDYFSHSNFVEACIQTLHDRGDRRATPLMMQLAQVHLADRPDLLLPRDPRTGTLQIETGTYATDQDKLVSKLELLQTELEHGYMARYAILGYFRWMQRKGEDIGGRLLGAAGGRAGEILGFLGGGIGGAVSGAIGGAGRGLVGGAASGFEAGERLGGGGITGGVLGAIGGGLGAIGGAVSGLFGGGAAGAREGAASGAASGREVGTNVGTAAGRGIGGAIGLGVGAALPAAAITALVMALPVPVLMGAAVGLTAVIAAAIAAARLGIIERIAQRKVAESGRVSRADPSQGGKGTTGPTHSELAKDDPEHPLFGIATGMAYLADREIAQAMRDAWESHAVHHTTGGAVPMPGGDATGGGGGGGPAVPATPVPAGGGSAPAGGGGTQGRHGRHPGEGPAFFAEVDRRFWAQTHYKVGGRLDPHNPADRPYVRIWLRIRDQVRAEREQAAHATRAEQPTQAVAAQHDGNGAAPEAPVAAWIPDEREETPVERGVTDLVDKYVCHPNQTDWWVDALVNPPRRGT